MWGLMALALIAGLSPEPEMREVAPGVHVLIGTSGNLLIVPSAQGALIVDSERPADFEEVATAVKRVSPTPVRYVVDTHWHMDHSGGNGGFAGVGAIVVAHRNVRVRRSIDQFMPAYNRHIPAAEPAALPAIVYDQSLELHVGNQTVELRHPANAHTDGDTIVRLVQANAIHMGDVYFNGIWPFIDTASGGGIRGLIAAVDMALGLVDAKTVIVPGHGALANREDLVRYRAMLADVETRVRDGIRAGHDRARIVGDKPAAKWRENMVGDEDRFVGAIYDSLS